MRLGAVAGLITPREGSDPLLGRVERAAELGIRATGVSLRGDANRDPGYLRSVRQLAAEKDVELRYSGVGVNFYEATDAEVDQAAQTLLFAQEHLGVMFTSTPGGPIQTTHRWHPGPPLAERKAKLAENLGRLADRVRPSGFTIALENHCDWRGHEIAEVVDKASRPNLKVQLDTGNAFSVFEEPVDCARVLAPYTISVHLKDVHVTPFGPAPIRGTRAVSVPLGEGHVDNVECVRLLQQHAPDPQSIPLLVEPFYMPEDTTPEAFLATSLAWMRQHLAEFLD
jgi:sugar phosphate isomerase/epimerase